LTCRGFAGEFRNVHQIRHSVANFLISESVPLGDVAKFLGDTVETVVKTYLHPAGTDPSDTLDRPLGGQSADRVAK
jgi:integrase